MSISGLAAAHASISALRGLAIDATEQANSGHPGLPLGAAPLAYVLFRHHLKHAPHAPQWPQRDRFVLSAGHGSALLYGLLHLSGYDLSLDDLRAFRSLNSRTPGHPEPACTPGVETITGPLGQGAAVSVGFALAERLVSKRFCRPPYETLFSHHTYALLSDGDIMEGIAFEAASLAGHWRLGKLVWLYDANDVTLDGPLSLCSGEDVSARFAALQWHVQIVEDGNTDLDAINEALTMATRETERPSLVIVRTTLGFGAPTKAGTHRAHGSPLGGQEAQQTKAALGLGPVGDFAVAPLAYEHMGALASIGEQQANMWRGEWAAWEEHHPELACAWAQAHAPRSSDAPSSPAALDITFDKPISTREASRQAIVQLAQQRGDLVGGDGDLSSSTLSQIPSTTTSGGEAGLRHIRYGVREHAMAAITTGLAQHGGLLPFAATFLVFSDYMRPAMRLAAMSGAGVLYVFTHDSVALGEDGPTHQPIEHLASLRAMPGLTVWRPADGVETVQAWQQAIARIARGLGPQALVLTRQTLPLLPQQASSQQVAQGAYIVAGHDKPDVVLIATGSEVHLALKARDVLAHDAVAARVVSMPSWECFAEAGELVQNEVLGTDVPRVAIEAASSFGWHTWVGTTGRVVGIDQFGTSAKGADALAALGMTCERVVSAARDVLSPKASS